MNFLFTESANLGFVLWRSALFKASVLCSQWLRRSLEQDKILGIFALVLKRDDLHTVVGFVTSSEQLCTSSWPDVMKCMWSCTCHTDSGVFSGAANSRLSIGQDSVGHSDTDKNPIKES